MTAIHNVNCANCGAAITLDESATEFTCPVCGTPQLIALHDGVEEIIEDTPTPHRVVDVFRYLVRHPVEMLVWRWNWKSGLMSGIVRSMIYLITHYKQGWRAAAAAMSVEFTFRIIVSGASGSLVQAFHRATPVWLATLCVMILLPAISHMIEFTLHTMNGDKNKGKAIIISVCFSIVSAVFNLFAMRRNTLLVKDDNQQSFWRDMAQMPAIVGEFMFYPIIWAWRRRKANNLSNLTENPDLP